MKMERSYIKEIEKLLGGFSQNSLENLLEEQNLLAGNIYKLSYTQILSLQKVGTQALNFSLLLHQSAWLSGH